MSLELFELKKSRAGKLLLYINDIQYHDLVDILELYRVKSGIVISQYSDTKLDSGLSSIINCTLEVMSMSKDLNPVQQKFLSVLQTAESENKSIIFLGE